MLPLEPLLVPLPLVLVPLPLVPLPLLLLLVPLLVPLLLPLPMPLLLLELDGGEEAGVLVEDGCLAHAVNSMAAASALRATFIFIDGTPVE